MDIAEARRRLNESDRMLPDGEKAILIYEQFAEAQYRRESRAVLIGLFWGVVFSAILYGAIYVIFAAY